MLLAILPVFLILFLLTRYVLRDILSKYFLQIYLVWWLLLLIISLTNPFGLYPVSVWTYALILLSVSCFSFGFMFNRLITKVDGGIAEDNFEQEIVNGFDRISKNKYFIIILIFFCLLILNYFLVYQPIVVLEGPEQAREMRFYVGNVFKNQYEIYFYNYVVESFSIFVSAFIAFSFVWFKFNKAFFLSLIFAYLYSSFGSGRLYVIELGFYIAFLFVVKNSVIQGNQIKLTYQEIKKIRKMKRISLFVIVPVLFIFYLFSIYLSNFRYGLFDLTVENFLIGNGIFFEQIVVYCVGSFRALDYGLNVIYPQFPITCGRLSFGGLDELFGFALKFLGVSYDYCNGLYGKLTSTNIVIGFDQEYNALFTNVFGQYVDFGLLGVVILSFFWGFVFNRFLVYFQNQKSFFLLLIVVYLFVIAILTPLSWKLQSPSSWVFLIVLAFLKKRNSKISKEKIINKN